MFLSKNGMMDMYTLSAFSVKVGMCCFTKPLDNGALLRWTNWGNMMIGTGVHFAKSGD